MTTQESGNHSSPVQEPQRQQATPDGSISTRAALAVVWRRAIRWVVLPLAAVGLFSTSYIAGLPAFRATGYKQGYHTGLASSIESDSARLVTDAVADAAKSTFEGTLLGLEPSTASGWYIARFWSTPASVPAWGLNDPRLDSTLVPVFSIQSKAIVGRWYHEGPDGAVWYVDR